MPCPATVDQLRLNSGLPTEERRGEHSCVGLLTCGAEGWKAAASTSSSSRLRACNAWSSQSKREALVLSTTRSTDYYNHGHQTIGDFPVAGNFVCWLNSRRRGEASSCSGSVPHGAIRQRSTESARVL